VDFAVKLAIGEGMKGEIEDLVEVQVLKKRCDLPNFASLVCVWVHLCVEGTSHKHTHKLRKYLGKSQENLKNKSENPGELRIFF